MRIAGDWLHDPATRRVMAALADAGQPARFVGGCVRNAVIGKPVADIDIATPARPGAVMAAIRAAGLKAAPTGIDHGVVTAICDHRPFEIATLRRDVATDGRRAVVAYSDDWAQDAARRDFTMNALYAEADGAVIDVLGGGLADLAARRVRFIGRPEDRIREDYLRILRFFRFAAWYGAGALDAEGLAACARLKSGMAQLSAERIGAEMKKLLAAHDPFAAVAAMAEAGVLGAIAPGAAAGAAFTGLRAAEAALDAAPDALVRLASLLLDGGGDARPLASSLRFSNAETDRLARIEAGARAAPAPVDSRAARVLVAERGGDAAVAAGLIGAARTGDANCWRRLIDTARNWTPPPFPLTGGDALAAGLQGPDIGMALSIARDAWIASDFTLDRDDLLAMLARAPSPLR